MNELEARVQELISDGKTDACRLSGVVLGDLRALVADRDRAERVAEKFDAERKEWTMRAIDAEKERDKYRNQLVVACEDIEQVKEKNADLRRQLREARAIINHGVELMSLEELSQWTGVRAWLEQGGEK